MHPLLKLQYYLLIMGFVGVTGCKARLSNVDSVSANKTTEEQTSPETTNTEGTTTPDTTPPVVNLGFAITTNVAFAPQTTISDESSLTYSWRKVSGPGTLTFSSQSSSPSISADQAGDYVIELVATDSAGNATTEQLDFTWFDGLIPLDITQDHYDDPTPVLNLFSPLTMSKVQIYDNHTCSGAPLKEAAPGGSYTSVELPLTTTGEYTFYAKFSGASACMTSGATHHYHRALSPGVTVTSVHSTRYAFAALYSNGMVMTWGSTANGGNSSHVAAKLSGMNAVTKIVSTVNAFAAIHADGSVTTWGSSDNGGNSDAVASRLNGDIDVTDVIASRKAFAAIHVDGSVTTWGAEDHGGSMTSTSYGADCNEDSTKGDAGCLDGTNDLIDVTSIAATWKAFAALRADGSVVTWGDPNNGGDSLGVAASINGTVDVNSISASTFAFAAIHVDGSVTAWGNQNSGGNTGHGTYGVDCDRNATKGDDTCLDGTDDSIDVVSIISTGFQSFGGAFAAIRADGSVLTWGHNSYGGNSDSVKTDLNGTNDVTSIYANDNAFAAVHVDGSVTTWGVSTKGGSSALVSAELDGTNDVTSISATPEAFAAIHADGSVTTWGLEASGGDFSSADSGADCNRDGTKGDGGCLDGTDNSKDVVDIVASRYAAFSALHADGSVTTWGDASVGGDSNSVATKLNGTKTVSSIAGNSSSFVAIHNDGTMTAWGDQNQGGNIAGWGEQLNGNNKILSVAHTTGAAAAVHADGSVTTWGVSSYGGDSSAVASRLDGSIPVTTIVGNQTVFSAIHTDGSVTTWGLDSQGGDLTSTTTGADCNRDGTPGDAGCLDGTNDIIKIFASKSAFVGLHADGSLTAWGSSGGGANLSAVAADLDGTIDVEKIYTTGEAFAAIHTDGSVTAWGSSMDTDSLTIGADCDKNGTKGDDNCLDGTADSKDVVELVAAQYAFAAIHADGSVTTWGDAGVGGDSNSVAARLDGTNDVKSIAASYSAFTAVHEDGTVTIWGQEGTGGDPSSVTFGADCNADSVKGDDACLVAANNIVSVTSNHTIYNFGNAFAALHADGSVTTWGNGISGGSSVAVATDLNGSNDVVKIVATSNSFAAIHIDGSVTTWGLGGGGNSSLVSARLDGTNKVLSLSASVFAFAAIHADGSVTTWGIDSYGGNSSVVSQSILAGITEIIPVYQGGFVALKQNGSAVSWENVINPYGLGQNSL